MDRLLKSPWFVKVIAFLLALMLYTIVAMESQTPPTGIMGEPETGSEVQYNRYPVQVIYDEDEYIVTDIPQFIRVQFTGDQSDLNKLNLQRAFEVFVDLSQLEEGTYENIPLEYKNLPEGVGLTFESPTIDVSIHKKVEKTFPITVEILNQNQLPKGYIAGDPELTKQEATVTGIKEAIDNIAFIKGFINVEGSTETIEHEVDLKAFDKNLNEIKEVNIELDPGFIEVTVPISNPQKVVSINVGQEGELPEGYVLKSIEVNPSEVTLHAPEDVLESIDILNNLFIDLSKITEDQTIELPVEIPNGAFYTEPNTITVTIDVEKDEELETMTFENLQIDILGLDEQKTLMFESPLNGNISFTVKGSNETLQAVSKEDFRAFVDVTNLSEGNHNVQIEIEGPKEVKIDQNVEQAAVTIKEKTTES